MLKHGKYRLVSTFLKCKSVKAGREWLGRAKTNKQVDVSASTKSQMVVDVSVLCRLDARTGIQRVVRSLLVQLLKNPPAGYQVRTVYATKYRGYRYVNVSTDVTGELVFVKTTDRVLLSQGDCFFGLDLSAHLIARHEHQFIRWKQQGVNVQIVVYDLLPLQRPEWFRRITTRNFQRWLRTITLCADGFICISQAVKNDFVEWLNREYSISEHEVKISVMPLGADIEASAPSNGITTAEQSVLDTLVKRPYVLMVGTIEPRKGHRHVLDAFEILWQQNSHTRLVVVGKPGWKTEKLQKRFKKHPQNCENFFWMTGVSDELLAMLYTRCKGVIVASEGEGFGLPLLEALHNDKPVLARKLPIFYEVAQDAVSYFEDSTPIALAGTIKTWIQMCDDETSPRAMPLLTTWQSCAVELRNILEKR